jgi:predicted DNA-binding transcriptional regulator AlpA
MNTPKTCMDAERLAVTAVDAARLLGISRAQLWKLHSSDRLPMPIRPGARAPRWRVDELRAWAAAACLDRASWVRMKARGGDRSIGIWDAVEHQPAA